MFQFEDGKKIGIVVIAVICLIVLVTAFLAPHSDTICFNYSSNITSISIQNELKTEDVIIHSKCIEDKSLTKKLKDAYLIDYSILGVSNETVSGSIKVSCYDKNGKLIDADISTSDLFFVSTGEYKNGTLKYECGILTNPSKYLIDVTYCR